MSDIPKFPRPSEIRAAMKAAKDASFRPTKEQRIARSNFWVAYQDEVGADRSTPIADVSLATALRLAGNTAISQWWDEPGFQGWFNDLNEFNAKVNHLVDVALDKIEFILDTSSDPDTLLKAARMMMELGRKFPAKAVDAPDKFLDDAIAKMNKDQLRAYLQRTAPKLLVPQVIDVPSTDNKEPK